MNVLDPLRTMREGVLEIRGDGKAGGGLVLAFQSLAALVASEHGAHVQEWPFFSSARRGANIRGFVRVSAEPIHLACDITRPQVVLLMNESTAETVDFAEGVQHGGFFLLNSVRTPEECAVHFRLSGRVFTVPGDSIGARYLHAPMGNVSAYAALAQAIGGVPFDTIVESFVQQLAKRRIPGALLERNRDALRATADAVRWGDFDCARPGDHRSAAFAGYGELPIGAQTPLRLSAAHHTASFARSGFRLAFADPANACTGCAHCITNCPEGIIRFRPDAEKGVVVFGADVSTFCKLCGECIAVCPETLFRDVPVEDVWDDRVPEIV